MAKLFPSSLTNRLVAATVALVAVVTILVAVVAALVMRSYLTDRLDSQLDESLNRASRVVQFGPPDGFNGNGGTSDPCSTPPIGRGQAAGSLTATISTTCGASGNQVTSSGDLRQLSSAALTELSDVKTDAQPRTINLPVVGDVRVAATTAEDGTVVVQGLPTNDVDDAIARFIWWEILLGVTGAVASAAAGSWIVRRQLRPLREVADTAHEVTLLPLESGEVGRTVRVPERLTDPATEVGQVGEALNQLLRHVEHALDARHASEQQVRQFLADASHELRTPLATIRGYAELGRRTGTDQTAKVESEAQRMSTLVDDMLLLARIDAGRPLEHEPVDLSMMLAEAVTDASVVTRDHEWRLDLPEEPVLVPGDQLRLHQAVTNLLRNAARHTPAGTTVTGRLRSEDGQAVLEVHDDGPGLDPDLVPVVFERFTRGESSRTRELGGAGLGTSLVRAIAEAHDGTASVSSAPGDTTFALTLPR